MVDLANQRTTQSLIRYSQSENYTEPIGLVSLWSALVHPPTIISRLKIITFLALINIEIRAVFHRIFVISMILTLFKVHNP